MGAGIKTILLGGAAGAAAAGLVWWVVSRKLDAQFSSAGTELLEQARPALRSEIQATLDREVPPRVRAELTETLRDFGLTPETGRRISQILAAADRVGLIGVGHGYLAGAW